jgi:hypothetical protein
LRTLLSQTLFGVLFRQFNLVFGKRRMQHDVSHQVEDAIVELRQR